MKRITTNIWSFPDVIGGNNVYVDKTDLLLKLIDDNARGSFFISRPRRFGKSLMLSTLQAIFEGRRELFEGLKISQTDYDWKTYPVLKLDMSAIKDRTCAIMEDTLIDSVMVCARKLSLSIPRKESATATFEALWKAVAEKGLQVVVLIDEYDVPLQGFFNKPDEYEKIRLMLHDFYEKLKTHADSIRFLMITGVTKIAKLSIFSGLNAPTDLTLDARYATLLGYTHEEVKQYFAEQIVAFAVQRKMTGDDVFNKLLEWYDHYRFSAESEACVLNPVSLGYALSRQLFENFWMETGQTSMVIERLKAIGMLPIELDGLEAEKSQLSVAEMRTSSIKALLYQAGYLTIKDVTEYGSLILGIPNFEVRETLAKEYLQTIITDDSVDIVYGRQRGAYMALEKGDIDGALAFFREALAVYPYEWLDKGKEGAAKVAFLTFFEALRNVTIHPERQIANGRIDAIVSTRNAIYIFEFKYNESAQAAFDQIIEKGYHLPYLHTSREGATQLPTQNSQLFKKVYGLGINYNPDPAVRGIDEPVVREICDP